MSYIIETSNPFQPLTDIRKYEHQGGITIWGWLHYQYPGFKEFDSPTICIVNGKPILREDWDYVIQGSDVINFVVIPTGLEILVLIIVVAAIAVSLTLGTPTPTTPGEQPASEPVFTTRGQANANRISEPIECCYGRNRIYPSFASRPYFQYVDNDQFQYSLFCIGQGFYDIEEIRIGDTEISLYEEVETEVTEPGGTVGLFPTNVYTAPEAGGQELFGFDEPEWAPDGWVGPFAASPSGSQSNAIQVDVVFPKGLYFSNSDGGLNFQSVFFIAQAREIDDAGTPIGIYFDLFGGAIEVRGKTTTPQRRTYSHSTTALRYEVRMRRTNIRSTGHRYGNTVKWEGLRSFILDTQAFGNVTLLAVKIRATNNLNSRTQQQFNIICTRKLQQHQSDGFTVPYIATRSIVWALVDIFRANYGGRVIDDTFYDWDALYALEALFESRNEHFDWIFRDPITVWDAARTVARAGRGVPLIIGSLISMVRDGPLTTPVAMFTNDNIIEGSLSWDVKLWDLDEFDSVRLEYTESGTGYKQETVLATLPGGTTDTPQDIRLPGIQDRDHAYHEALYILAVDRYQRENVSFDTGLEGYIPTFGDLIIVAHDVPRWSASGYVVHGESESNGDFHIWLSEPVAFTAGSNHIIYLRDNLGDLMGPYDCYQTADTRQVRINTSVLIDFLEGGTTEPMLFVFGISGQVNKFVRVVKIEPQGRETIRITAVNESAVIHSFDGLSAPALANDDTVPVTPDLPVVASVEVTQLNSTVLEVLASWGAAFGADYYVVQEGSDGVNWNNVATTDRTSIQFQVPPGTLYVRVAGVGLGQGPWVQDIVSVGNLVGLDVVQAFTALTWTVEWLELLNALSYDVRVYDSTAEPSAPVFKKLTNILFDAERTYTYDLDAALADGNVNREMLVTVTPKFSDADGTAVELEIINLVPSPPTTPFSSTPAQDSDLNDMEYVLNWTVPAEDDLIRVAVWLETTQGFDPEVETPILDEIQSAVGYATLSESLGISIFFDSNGEHAAHYWRVAVFDVWGNEISTNITTEQTIVATSGWVP